MQGLKLLKQRIEEVYHEELDKAVENRIRHLDVVHSMREWSNQKRREAKAALAKTQGETP